MSGVARACPARTRYSRSIGRTSIGDNGRRPLVGKLIPQVTQTGYLQKLPSIGVLNAVRQERAASRPAEAGDDSSLEFKALLAAATSCAGPPGLAATSACCRARHFTNRGGRLLVVSSGFRVPRRHRRRPGWRAIAGNCGQQVRGWRAVESGDSQVGDISEGRDASKAASRSLGLPQHVIHGCNEGDARVSRAPSRRADCASLPPGA